MGWLLRWVVVKVNCLLDCGLSVIWFIGIVLGFGVIVSIVPVYCLVKGLGVASA